MGHEARRPTGEHSLGSMPRRQHTLCPLHFASAVSLPGHVTAARRVRFLVTAGNYVTLVEVWKALGYRSAQPVISGTVMFPTAARGSASPSYFGPGCSVVPQGQRLILQTFEFLSKG